MTIDVLLSPMDAGAPPTSANPGARGRVQSRLRGLPESDGFDALTDLFLGEVSGDRSRARPEAGAEHRAEHGTPTSIVPNVAAPAPLAEVAPTNLHDASESEISSSAPASPENQDGAARGGTGRAIIECVVLGNLPAGAGTWAGQYVREIAEVSGREVACLRIDGGYAHLEIVSGDRMTSEAASPTLEDAITRAARRTSRWVIRTDAAHELSLAADVGVDIVTLLTGADEAARVSAYASVKLLAERLASAGSEGSGPAVRVAMMGVDSIDGAAAAKKVADAVRAFLGRDVQLAACAGKIRSVRTSGLLFSGPTGLSPSAAPALILANEAYATSADTSFGSEEPKSILESAGATTLPFDSVVESDATRPEADMHRADQRPLVEALDSAMLAGTSSTDDGLSDAIVAASSSGDFAEPGASFDLAGMPSPATKSTGELRALDSQITTPSRSSTVVPPASMAQGMTAEPARVVAQRTPIAAEQSNRKHGQPSVNLEGNNSRCIENSAMLSLSAHLAGLTPLAARCPHAPRVEISMDSIGTLHLLVSSRGDAGGSSIADLLVAESWLRSHAALLGAGATSAAPVLHLFTSEPKSIRRLLDTGLRVHLLVRIGDNDADGLGGTWYCTDLN